MRVCYVHIREGKSLVVFSPKTQIKEEFVDNKKSLGCNPLTIFRMITAEKNFESDTGNIDLKVLLGIWILGEKTPITCLSG